MLNGDSSQASDSSPVEVTKKTIRNDIWRDLQKNQFCIKPNYSFYQIPRFVGSEDAAAALKELDVFKNATHIMVNPERAQSMVRLTCLQEGKTLYVQPPHIKSYLMTKLNVKEDATEEDFLNALMFKGLEEFGTQIGLDDNITLDLVVVGSVAVSKDGNRIGRGQNSVDLCLGLLQEINFITPHTTIVTIVHDSQVVDSIPENVMRVHDYPVDLIVTPTQVIATNAKSENKRPSGIIWNLISERRFKAVSLLATLREKQMQSGNACELKETESEAESYEAGNRRPRRYLYGRRMKQRRQQNGATHSESEQVENGDGEMNGGRKKRQPYLRFQRFRRHTNENDGSVTKYSYRNKSWQLLQKNKVCTTSRHPYRNRIPGYKGTEDVAQVVRQLDEYKNATNVLLSIDKTQEPLRLACLEDGKKVYVLLPMIREEFVLRLDVPEGGETKPELKDVASRPGINEYGVHIDLEKEKVSLDLLVFGSLAVSKEGFRIAEGYGHADLCYALLRQANVVTASTPIITTVHDCQVFETFPPDLFSEHDVPVDIIATPTHAITVEKMSPAKEKPDHIMWDHISPRKLKFMTYVNNMREKLIEAGETCELKKDDENYFRRRKNYRNNYSESEPNETGEVESGDNRRPRGPRRFFRQRRSTNNEKDLEGGMESGGNNLSPDTTTRKRRTNTKPRPAIDFSIRLSNIQRNMRVRDLRTALQERSVKPNLITWKGYKGFCYLHFNKASPQTQGEGDIQLGADSILESLANLTLYPSTPAEDTTVTPETASLPNKLVVQLAKRSGRIESEEQPAATA